MIGLLKMLLTNKKTLVDIDLAKLQYAAPKNFFEGYQYKKNKNSSSVD